MCCETLSDICSPCMHAGSGREPKTLWREDQKKKVDKVEIFVPVIRGPNLCDFGRRAIIEELGKERETPGDNRLLFYSSKKVNGDDDENSETKRNLRKNMKNHKNNHFTCQCLCFFSAVFLPHLPFFSTS